jgi:hypothetical protein
MVFSYVSTFEKGAIGISEAHRQCVEKDRLVTSYIVYREVLQSFKYIIG